MIDVSRNDLVMMLEAGYIYLAMYKFKEARLVFEGVATLAPKHDVPQVAVGNVLFAQGKYLEAIRVIKQAIKDNPKSAFAFAHMGEALLFYGKYDEARKCLEKASQLEKGGKSGDFARSLMKLMDQGYDPVKYREDHKKMVREQKRQHKTATARETVAARATAVPRGTATTTR